MKISKQLISLKNSLFTELEIDKAKRMEQKVLILARQIEDMENENELLREALDIYRQKYGEDSPMSVKALLRRKLDQSLHILDKVVKRNER